MAATYDSPCRPAMTWIGWYWPGACAERPMRRAAELATRSYRRSCEEPRSAGGTRFYPGTRTWALRLVHAAARIPRDRHTISHQSHNKALLAKWRTAVATAAQAVIPEGQEPVAIAVELFVVYYYEDGPAIPDEDNLLKPIQDALSGIMYDDDAQVTDGTCCKRNIDGEFRVRNWSPVLAEGFVQGDEFVHVVVRAAPDPGVLLP